jgi:hypothetical protein
MRARAFLPLDATVCGSSVSYQGSREAGGAQLGFRRTERDTEHGIATRTLFLPGQRRDNKGIDVEWPER